MMPFDRVEERYRNDPMFHAIVDTLEAAIHRLELTPAEVREAAMYACNRFEMRRGMPSIIIRTDPMMPPDVLRIEQDGRTLAVVPIRGEHPYRGAGPDRSDPR